MKITKVSHSCVFIEKGDTKILIDPGAWSPEAEQYIDQADYVIITHQHGDHLDPEILKNTSAEILCNQEVAKIISDIKTIVIKDQEEKILGDITIKAYETDHLPIHDEIPTVRNTGILFDGIFYNTGDALHIPEKEVKLLTLPVVAPFLDMADVISYARKVNPEKSFPVHDGIIKTENYGPFHAIPKRLLGDSFLALTNNQGIEI